MKILLTGASSFSGLWFVRELVAAGHSVTAVFPRPEAQYEGARAQRVALLPSSCEKVFNAPFGSRAFLRAVSADTDVFCHHAAHVYEYKSPDFNAIAALNANTRNLPAVLKTLQRRQCSRIVLTGSVFEAGEGGSATSPALSPYGLSKSLTTAYFRYYTHQAGMRLGHFVIPNPFGPMEEPRFTAYLIREWKKGNKAAVNTPDYLRDNIHVSLLAKAYAQFAAGLPASAGFSRLRPSGYVETQGAFARRFARAISKRLQLPCALTLAKQTDFSEPMKRINNQPLDARALKWSEKRAWDDIADFYR